MQEIEKVLEDTDGSNAESLYYDPDSECHGGGGGDDWLVCEDKHVGLWPKGGGHWHQTSWVIDDRKCPQNQKPLKDLLTVVAMVNGYEPQGIVIENLSYPYF